MKLTIHPSFLGDKPTSGGKKLSQKQFIVAHILILIAGLSFLFGLYYILNIQYQQAQKPFEAGPVTSKPKSFTLDLDQPADDSLTFSPQVLLSGKTAPNLEILISTQSSDQVIKSKSDGTFSLTLNLDEGVNNISVTAFDATGDSKSAERVVYFSKEKI
ncbi:hypothetical protein HYZ05_00145 [Candidatus Daviesbacteria bacterium]|nr:hypothetical protein [Candidatus Daviesbacteria bacterium]